MNRATLQKKKAFVYGAGVILAVITIGGALWLLRPPDNFDYTSLQCSSNEVSPGRPLTAQQLTDIFLIPERTKLHSPALQKALPTPACTLPDLEMRPGAFVKRSIFKLAFNRQALLVVGTEGDEYIGFRIRGLKEGAVTLMSDNVLNIYQNWHVTVGETINGATVIGSLGQVSLRLNGKMVVAPFDGHATQMADACIRFDGLDVPGYVMQFCGLDTNFRDRDRLINKDKPIGSGNMVLIGVLRRQANGAWAFVEPSPQAIKAVIK